MCCASSSGSSGMASSAAPTRVTRRLAISRTCCCFRRLRGRSCQRSSPRVLQVQPKAAVHSDASVGRAWPRDRASRDGVTGFRRTMRGRREMQESAARRRTSSPGSGRQDQESERERARGQRSRSDVWEGTWFWEFEFFGRPQAGSLDPCSSAMDRGRQRLAACRPARPQRRVQMRRVPQVPNPFPAVPQWHSTRL